MTAQPELAWRQGAGVCRATTGDPIKQIVAQAFVWWFAHLGLPRSSGLGTILLSGIRSSIGLVS